MADDRENGILWEAPEHHHIEKGGDWYWAVGIVAIAASVAAIAFGNALFGLLILIAAGTTILVSSREPDIVIHAISNRGVHIGEEFFPYSTLHSFYIDEEDPRGPQLLVRTEKFLSPLIILPLPEDAVDDIEYVLEERLPKEHLEEPFGHKILEFFGF